MLRYGVVTPIHSYTFRLAACSVLGGVIALAATSKVAVDVPPPPALEIREDVAMAVTPVHAAGEVYVIFRAEGATYMQLREADPMPAHGAPVLFDRGEASGWQTIAIAETADVPGWRGRSVVVDGTCTAKVIGFAVVARLTGSPDYAGDLQTWTAEAVMAHGAPVVAAQLDGCDAGALATAAVPFHEDRDATLVGAARAKLFASAVGANAQRAWTAEGRAGTWHASADVVVDARVLRDRETTYVSVNGRIDEGCGGVAINTWGLYRIDGAALVPVYERTLEAVHTIEKLVDVDGDGAPDVLGKSWLGDATILWSPSRDEVLARTEVPFYGCGC